MIRLLRMGVIAAQAWSAAAPAQETPVPLTRAPVQSQRTMPRVIGMPVSDAQTALSRVGIPAAAVSEVSGAGVAPGTVVRQAPAAGSVLQPGITAQLYVAAAEAVQAVAPGFEYHRETTAMRERNRFLGTLRVVRACRRHAELSRELQRLSLVEPCIEGLR